MLVWLVETTDDSDAGFAWAKSFIKAFGGKIVTGVRAFEYAGGGGDKSSGTLTVAVHFTEC